MPFRRKDPSMRVFGWIADSDDLSVLDGWKIIIRKDAWHPEAEQNSEHLSADKTSALLCRIFCRTRDKISGTFVAWATKVPDGI